MKTKQGIPKKLPIMKTLDNLDLSVKKIPRKKINNPFTKHSLEPLVKPNIKPNILKSKSKISKMSEKPSIEFNFYGQMFTKFLPQKSTVKNLKFCLEKSVLNEEFDEDKLLDNNLINEKDK